VAVKNPLCNNQSMPTISLKKKYIFFVFLWFCCGLACTRTNTKSVTKSVTPSLPNKNLHQVYLLYRVKGGDVLSKIALRFRVAGGYLALAMLNGLSHPQRLNDGQLLRIPRKVPYTNKLRSLPLIWPNQPTLISCGKKYTKRVILNQCQTSKCAVIISHKQVCINVGKRDRICKILMGDTYEMVYHHGKTGTSLWKGSLNYPWTEQFEVHGGDLSGDDTDELVIINRSSVSNGLAAIYDEVGIIDISCPASGLVRFRTVSMNIPLVRLGSNRHCSIGAHNMESGQSDYLRGDGNYWVTRFYRYHRGELIPEKSLIRRERLSAKAKVQGLEQEWLEMIYSRTRTIIGKVKHMDNKRITIDQQSGIITSLAKFRQGHWKTRRLYPDNYQPSTRHQSLNGKKVHLITYDDSDYFPTTVLWR
jgi:LysM domain